MTAIDAIEIERRVFILWYWFWNSERVTAEIEQRKRKQTKEQSWKRTQTER